MTTDTNINPTPISIQEKLAGVLIPVVLAALALLTGSMPVFTVALLVLLSLWFYLFYSAGDYEFRDIPLLLLLLGTFSLGRAFSLIGIPTGRAPIYITELVLALALLLLLLKWRSPVKLLTAWHAPLSKTLMVAVAVYFLLGVLYLGISFIVNGMAALRDIVFCIYALFIFITISHLDNARKIRVFWRFMVPAVILITLYSIIVFFFRVPGETVFRQLTRDIKMTNLGLSHGLVVVMGLSFFTLTKKKGKWLLGLALYLSLLFVVMAEVRAAWVGLLVVLIFLAVLLRKHLLVFIPILALVAASIFLIDYFNLGVKKNKLAALKHQVKTVRAPSLKNMASANIKWRLDIWEQTGEEILERPVFGWGYGTQIDYLIFTRRLSWIRIKSGQSGIVPPHNHLLSITYKMGILGLALFLFINAYIFFYGLSYLKKCRSEFNRRFLMGALGGLLYWHGMAFFFDVLESPPTGIYLWIILGTILSIIHLEKEEANC